VVCGTRLVALDSPLTAAGIRLTVALERTEGPLPAGAAGAQSRRCCRSA